MAFVSRSLLFLLKNSLWNLDNSFTTYYHKNMATKKQPKWNELANAGMALQCAKCLARARYPKCGHPKTAPIVGGKPTTRCVACVAGLGPFDLRSPKSCWWASDVRPYIERLAAMSETDRLAALERIYAACATPDYLDWPVRVARTLENSPAALTFLLS